MSLFNKFTPKGPKFFPHLKEMSDVILASTDFMIDFIHYYDHETAVEYYKKIKEQEKKGDEVSNLIFEELNKTFITPFDREDIDMLSMRLDDVTDHINSCAKRMVLYNPKKLPPQAMELALVLKDAALCIGKAVDELDVLKKDARRVIIYCTELHDLENKADDIYEHFLIELFEEEKNGIELIKQKEILGELEKATDVAEYVGKIIKTIIIKYA
jgi:predicted phosphate transport protein (TIGR00153 family)